MISPKKFIAKWHQVAAIRRRVSKGYFVVYTMEKRRFVIPLKYLNNNVFKELFRMSEEVFGLPSNGPIVLPCDAVFMEYIVTFVQKCPTNDLEEALLISMDSAWRSKSCCLHLEQTKHQFFLSSLRVLI